MYVMMYLARQAVEGTSAPETRAWSGPATRQKRDSDHQDRYISKQSEFSKHALRSSSQGLLMALAHRAETRSCESLTGPNTNYNVKASCLTTILTIGDCHIDLRTCPTDMNRLSRSQ